METAVTARETYEQYLKGEITLAQVEQRTRAWYEAWKVTRDTAHSSRDGTTDGTSEPNT